MARAGSQLGLCSATDSLAWAGCCAESSSRSFSMHLFQVLQTSFHDWKHLLKQQYDCFYLLVFNFPFLIANSMVSV